MTTPADCNMRVGWSGQPHVHNWIIGRFETESLIYPGTIIPVWGRVAYLVCQCGAVRRAIPDFTETRVGLYADAIDPEQDR